MSQSTHWVAWSIAFSIQMHIREQEFGSSSSQWCWYARFQVEESSEPKMLQNIQGNQQIMKHFIRWEKPTYCILTETCEKNERKGFKLFVRSFQCEESEGCSVILCDTLWNHFSECTLQIIAGFLGTAEPGNDEIAHALVNVGLHIYILYRDTRNGLPRVCTCLLTTLKKNQCHN